jgi:hypothetical protein
MAKVANRRPFWAGLSAASVAVLTIGYLLLQSLSKDQQVAFFGSAFGATVAALTAFGVVEYSAHAQRRAGKRILVDLLRKVQTGASELNDATDGATIESHLIAIQRVVEQAIAVAEDFRSQLPGAAAAVVYLLNTELSTQKAIGLGKTVSPEIFTRICELIRDAAVSALRQIER